MGFSRITIVAVKEDTKETCDLLEVYDSADVEFLKSSVDEDWKLFGTEKQTESDTDYIHFSNTEMEEAQLNSSDSEDEDEFIKTNNSDSELDIDDL